MRTVSFVTGANGHLGNNLVRQLLKKGGTVKAGVRDVFNSELFQGLDCEIMYNDMLDIQSLKKAFKGVDVLYHAAAVYKHWSENPEEDIIKVNVEGTENVLRAAKEAAVKKIVYVSSVVALEPEERDSNGMISPLTWNKNNYGQPYIISKTESEKLAWKLADELELNMTVVLPGSIVAGEYSSKKTPTAMMCSGIVNGKFPFYFDTTMSPIHVDDVVRGMILAAEKGKRKRYVLAAEKPITMERMIEIAMKVNPAIVKPEKKEKEELLAIAAKLEEQAKKMNTTPMLQVSNVKMYYGLSRDYDNTESKIDLGFTYQNPEEALELYYNKLYQG